MAENVRKLRISADVEIQQDVSETTTDPSILVDTSNSPLEVKRARVSVDAISTINEVEIASEIIPETDENCASSIKAKELVKTMETSSPLKTTPKKLQKRRISFNTDLNSTTEGNRPQLQAEVATCPLEVKKIKVSLDPSEKEVAFGTITGKNCASSIKAKELVKTMETSSPLKTIPKMLQKRRISSDIESNSTREGNGLQLHDEVSSCPLEVKKIKVSVGAVSTRSEVEGGYRTTPETENCASSINAKKLGTMHISPAEKTTPKTLQKQGSSFDSESNSRRESIKPQFQAEVSSSPVEAKKLKLVVRSTRSDVGIAPGTMPKTDDNRASSIKSKEVASGIKISQKTTPKKFQNRRIPLETESRNFTNDENEPELQAKVPNSSLAGSRPKSKGLLTLKENVTKSHPWSELLNSSQNMMNAVNRLSQQIQRGVRNHLMTSIATKNPYILRAKLLKMFSEIKKMSQLRDDIMGLNQEKDPLDDVTNLHTLIQHLIKQASTKLTEEMVYRNINRKVLEYHFNCYRGELSRNMKKVDDTQEILLEQFYNLKEELNANWNRREINLNRMVELMKSPYAIPNHSNYDWNDLNFPVRLQDPTVDSSLQNEKRHEIYDPLEGCSWYYTNLEGNTRDHTPGSNPGNQNENDQKFALEEHDQKGSEEKRDLIFSKEERKPQDQMECDPLHTKLHISQENERHLKEKESYEKVLVPNQGRVPPLARIGGDPPLLKIESDPPLLEIENDPPLLKIESDPPLLKIESNLPLPKHESDPSLPRIESDPPLQKTESDPPLEKIGSDPPLEKIGSDPPLEKIGSDPPLEKIGSDPPLSNEECKRLSDFFVELENSTRISWKDQLKTLINELEKNRNIYNVPKSSATQENTINSQPHSSESKTTSDANVSRGSNANQSEPTTGGIGNTRRLIALSNELWIFGFHVREYFLTIDGLYTDMRLKIIDYIKNLYKRDKLLDLFLKKTLPKLFKPN